MKKFLIIGTINAITYKEIFPLIKENKMWFGFSSFNCGMYFQVPENYEYANTYKFNRERNGHKVMRVSSICWYTNLDNTKCHTELDLYKKYNVEEYPKYDNYDAIEVSKVAEIPMDYDGVMGVPITFLDKYCPTQFEIVDARTIALNDKQKNKSTYLIKDADSSINGKAKYARLVIKRKK